MQRNSVPLFEVSEIDLLILKELNGEKLAKLPEFFYLVIFASEEVNK